MSDTIIVAVVSGLFVAIPAVIATVTSNNKSTALMRFRIDQLDSKVEKHNEVIKRTFVLEEQMKVVNHRIKDLEEQEKEGK